MKKELLDIFRLIRKNKLLFAVSCFLELGFIVSFLVLFWKIVYVRIFSLLTRIYDIVGILNNLPEELAGQADAFKALSGSIEFMGLYSSLIRWLLIFIISVFLLAVVFQGLNFTLAARMIDRKISFWRYFGRFSSICAFFYLLVVFSFWLTIYLSVLNAKIILPVFSQGVINFILVLLLLLISYFFSISSVLIMKKGVFAAFLQSFKSGVMKIHKVLLIDFLAILKIGVCLMVLYWLFQLDFIAFLLWGLFLFIPSIIFARIMFFYLMEKLLL